MSKCVLIIGLLFSSYAIASENLPIWEYPILGSDHIGSNCSEGTNKVLMKISFSPEGFVEDLVFIKKSTISEINQEAKKHMMEESPFYEFEDMSIEEKEKYKEVLMSYIIPCETT